MTRTLLTLGLLLSSTAAFASGSSVFRYASESMTCRQARNVVANKGAVLLIWGEGYLYERVVHHAGFCEHGERVKPTMAPTRDLEDCYVGYRCENGSDGGGGETGQ